MKPTNPEVIDLGHGDRVSVEFYGGAKDGSGAADSDSHDRLREVARRINAALWVARGGEQRGQTSVKEIPKGKQK